MAAAAMAVGATAGAARSMVEHMVGGWRQRRRRRHCRRHCLLRQAAPPSSVYRTLSLMRAGRDPWPGSIVDVHAAVIEVPTAGRRRAYLHKTWSGRGVGGAWPGAWGDVHAAIEEPTRPISKSPRDRHFCLRFRRLGLLNLEVRICEC